MTELQFQALMPLVSADLVDMISKEDKLSYDEAIDKLYNSELYSYLEKEETKLWYYSTHTLYSMLKDEENGHLERRYRHLPQKSWGEFLKQLPYPFKI